MIFNGNKILIFDIDGTLTDTGPSHITFCNHINNEKSYGLKIIDPSNRTEVKKILGTPMRTILTKYGFPEKDLDYIDQLYAKKFGRDNRYRSDLFPGIDTMLYNFHKDKYTMCTLTSNTIDNVKKDLGKEIFDLFTYNIDREMMKEFHSSSKEDALYALIRCCFDFIPSHAFIMIGDTIKDYEAAKSIGTHFIGVSYGWEINPDDSRFPVANNTRELEEMIRNT